MKATLAMTLFAVLALGAGAMTYYDYYGDAHAFPDGYGKAYAVPTNLYGSYYYQSNAPNADCGSYYYRNGQRYCSYRSPTYNVYYGSAYATPTPPTVNIYHVGTPAPNPYRTESQPTAYLTNPYTVSYSYAAPLPSCVGRCVYETANTRPTATPGGYWLGEPNYWYYAPYEGYSS